MNRKNEYRSLFWIAGFFLGSPHGQEGLIPGHKVADLVGSFPPNRILKNGLKKDKMNK